MARFYGGKVVTGGFYLSHSTWKLEPIAKEGGTLPGNKQTRYSRLPVPALVVVGPLMGLVYVISIPAVYCLTFIFMLIRLGGRKLRAAGHRNGALISNVR